jgi:cytochrome c oxidase subunit 2
MRFVRNPWVVHGAALGACLIAVLGASSRAGVQDSDEPRRIDVVARRFTFEPAEIEVRSGERIELHVRSADGVHGLEIRQLKIKGLIARGGSITRIEFAAPAPGQYPILCSEYCGADHDDMKGLLVVRASDAPPAEREPR